MGIGLNKSLIESKLAAGSRPFFVMDERVFQIYSGKFDFLEAGNFITIVSNEENKTIETFMRIAEALHRGFYERGDTIFAIGGGVVGDLAAFVAATYKRGLKLIHVPTTLIAMADSSIGGKNAVNYKGSKNIIGTFYDAEGEILDFGFLESLPKSELCCGLFEIIKIASVSDAVLFDKICDYIGSETYLTNILYNGEAGGIKNKKDLYSIIQTARDLKKRIVSEDKFDNGSRMRLNFGHSIGHGLESLYGIKHGEAVALGMLMITKWAVKKNCTEIADAERLFQLVDQFELPAIQGYRAEELVETMLYDKKRKGLKNRLVYMPELGTYDIAQLEDSELTELVRHT